MSVDARRKFHRILKHILRGSIEIIKKKSKNFDFLEIQWLRLFVSTVGGADSVSGQGTEIPHTQWHKKKKKKVKLLNRNPPLSSIFHLYLPFYRSHGIQNNDHPFSHTEEWTLGKCHNTEDQIFSTYEDFRVRTPLQKPYLHSASQDFALTCVSTEIAWKC